MQNIKILVWLPSPMGDAILCTPALRAIREKYASSEIFFLANPTVRNILSPCPFNDSWLEYGNINPLAIAKKLRGHNFSHAILFKNSFASAMSVFLARIPSRIGYCREMRGFLLTENIYPEKLSNGKYKPLSMVDYYLEIASKSGADVSNKKTELTVDQQDTKSLQSKLPEVFNSDGPVIILVPGGAFGPSKCWPADNFAKTANQLIKDFNSTVVVSVSTNQAEQNIAKEICSSKILLTSSAKKKLINLADNPLNLGQLKSLFTLADLVITNDTGPRHIAVALGRKVVTLFGPNDPVWTDTEYENEIQITGNVTCSPCQKPECIRGQRICMESISVETVLEAAKELLKNNPGHIKVFTRNHFIRISDSFFVDSDYKTSLSNKSLESIDDIFSFSSAKDLKKKNLASFRSRLEFQINSPKATTLFLKRYDNPPVKIQLKNWLAGRGKKSLGFLEYETSEKLKDDGINTPKTVAYGDQWGTFFEKRSFFITEKIPNAEALERKLPDYFSGNSTPEKLKMRRDFITSLANFVKKFHKTDYRHRDLYLCHIFYNDKGEFYLIDLARAFMPLIFKKRFQIKDIAQLFYSAPGSIFSRTDRMRFYLNYIGRKKLSSDDKVFIHQVIKKVHQIARHDNKHGKQAPFEK
ncbi:MAG: lipopolysaccharide heptosyltransferase II [Sedimentisphaerales bacterium]|nr:lipopolysaccharide heptosyltransferase II [Sedimentisphaerales bacterium]